MPATPALDTLAASARRWLADHFDEVVAEEGLDLPTAAAQQAAESVASHPWDGGIPNPDRPDPVDAPDARLQRLLDAFGELQQTAADPPLSADSLYDAGLAANLHAAATHEMTLLTELAQVDPSLQRVDAAAMRIGLAAMYRALATFLVERSHGLLADARALAAGAADVDDGPL